MSHTTTTKTYYTVKQAAQKLNICPTSLLKKMLWHGWLYKGAYRNDPLKNMPLPHAVEAGFIKKIKRKAPAPHDWEIAITEAGMKELGNPVATPTPRALTEANANLVKIQGDNKAAEKEREKLLAEFGLPFLHKAS
jgi:hypothetical protein